MEKIISVGIDIGTSTTQVIFSHITIENLASAYSVPQIDIIDKNVFIKVISILHLWSLKLRSMVRKLKK